jgi:hypothetical protein
MCGALTGWTLAGAPVFWRFPGFVCFADLGPETAMELAVAAQSVRR